MHPNLQHWRVALRIFRNLQFAHQLLRIAQVSASLNHSCIPALHEVGEYESTLYMVRHFVNGEDLQVGIGDITRPAKQVAHIITEVASALEYAHERGTVHGYVHPRHLLLDREDSVWLIGFGEYPPESPDALGTYHLAPEQLDTNVTVSPLTDVYGLGETAFWLLSGRHPFQAFRDGDLVAAKREGRMARGISEVRKDVPRAVDAVLQRAMALQPQDRFASAKEFASALCAAVSQHRKKSWWRSIWPKS